MIQPANSQLFLRACNVTIGPPGGVGTLLSGYDVSFDIKKSVKKEPNSCHLKVWDLSTTTRMQVESSPVPNSSSAPVACIISAGYVGAMSTIFSGQLRSAQTVQEAENQITEITSGDGDQAIGQSRLTVAFTQGSTATQNLNKILLALGVGQGNLPTAQTLVGANPAIAQMFSLGGVFKGSASDIMDDFCRSSGMEWSVQDGALQILPLGGALPGNAIFIDSSHGMEESPTVDTKGILAVTTRLIPGIKPGCLIVVSGKYQSGAYRVRSCNYVGSTREKEWSIKIEADLYSPK